MSYYTTEGSVTPAEHLYYLVDKILNDLWEKKHSRSS